MIFDNQGPEDLELDLVLVELGLADVLLVDLHEGQQVFRVVFHLLHQFARDPVESVVHLNELRVRLHHRFEVEQFALVHLC